MSDTYKVEESSPGRGAEHASDRRGERRQRKRRPWRVTLISLGSLLGLVVVLAASGYAYVNHVASSIPRVSVAHLVAADGPANGSGQTFLVTDSPSGPTDSAIKASSSSDHSNLVMLLHINADGRGGAAVSIPVDTLVPVPGHGTQQLWYALKVGGPSLLVQTVSQVTGVPINHYARIDFTHMTNLVNAVGGVNVTLPAKSTSFGHTFSAGVNHLTGVTAIYYSRDPSLSVEGRMLRQEVFVRAVMTKIADDHLLTNPVTAVSVLNSITSALTVDSNMTNSEIESLARNFGNLGGNAATYVTAPTRTAGGKQVLNTAIADQLWAAIKHSSVATFAKKYPSTVTPSTVP